MSNFGLGYFNRGFEEGVSQGSQMYAIECAKKFFKNGASYDLVRASIETLTDEELQKIYDEVMATTV